MKRRDFLAAGTAAALGSLAAPRISRAQSARVLRFVPQANLSSLDAVAGTQYVVRNAGLMVWDTLYGIDSTITPKPQMAEGHEASADFKTWTFRLRPGLKFHDGAPVLARDVIASLNRWMARDTMGQRIKASMDAFEAPDDRTVRMRLNKPFPKMLFALGKNNAPVALIMPERIAKTDPFHLITEYVGSGPMMFRKDEWVPGSRAVFERFGDYAPRAEAADWLAGGKRMMFDRIEWLILPDDATKAAALQNGEIDWWENPIPDLVPLLKRKSDRSWREKVEKGMQEWWKLMDERAAVAANPINPQLVFAELSKRLPDRAILSSDSGSAANWFARDIKIREDMMASLSGNLATMGPGVPYAIAAKFAFPERPVFALVGDGAMQMNGINELITISKYWKDWRDPRFYVLVLNNRDLNQVTWELRAMAGSPNIPSTQTLPDFSYAQYAEQLGLNGIRIETAAGVGAAWDAALKSDRPVVIEAMVDPDVPPLPPHITLEQAKSFTTALLKGDPEARGIMEQAFRAMFPKKTE